MKKLTIRKTTHAVLNEFGPIYQQLKAIEELGELSAALARSALTDSLPSKKQHASVIDELADVTIVLDQMIHWYGEAEVKERIQFKLARLQKLLDGMQ